MEAPNCRDCGDAARVHLCPRDVEAIRLQLSRADKALNESEAAYSAMVKQRDSANRLIDELKDKASVAAVILRQYVEGSGIPLERSVIARQLIETFEKLTERPNDLGLDVATYEAAKKEQAEGKRIPLDDLSKNEKRVEPQQKSEFCTHSEYFVDGDRDVCKRCGCRLNY